DRPALAARSRRRPPARRRHRRNGRPELQPVLPLRRSALRRADALPAARHQRPRSRRQRPRSHAGIEEALPRRSGLRHRLRHDARAATIKAMAEVTGPIVAVALVLCAVFVPCAFISGITGQFFHQFAVTIAVSTVISAINAVTMTPSRAVLIFKAEAARQGDAE